VSDADAGAPDATDTGGLYIESPIIMATVRVVAPFVFTFGLFIMFHGADSAGGGFQGGVIVGTVILMLGIAFGIEPTRDWVRPEAIAAIAALGTAAFLLTGFATVALGGTFLEYHVIPISHASKYAIEFVELAIGVIVSSVVVGLFFGITGGTDRSDEQEEGVL